jgi:hypothetical protein
MNTNSPLKNESLPAKPTAVPDFASWSQVVLAKFAQESHAKMQAQEAEIEQLKTKVIQGYKDVLEERLANNLEKMIDLREHNTEIEQLRQDLKMALNAYREVLKK